MAVSRTPTHKVAVDPVAFYKMEMKTKPTNVPLKLTGGPMREDIMGGKPAKGKC